MIVDDKGAPQEIPAEIMDDARSCRDSLVETAVEVDDELINKYLEGEEDHPGGADAGPRRPVSQAGALFPVLCGSALANRAVAPLLDAHGGLHAHSPGERMRFGPDGEIPATEADRPRTSRPPWCGRRCPTPTSAA